MYFDQPGKVNTRETLTAAYDRARELGLDEVVLASTSGETAFIALDVFKDFRITAVTYHHGYIEPFKPIMPYRTRKQLEEKGVAVISATHALSGVERAVAKKHSGVYPALLIADTPLL